MMSACRSLLAMLALVSTQVPIARAEDVAAPPMQAGDSWVFRLTASSEGRPDVRYRLKYSVARQDAPGRWIIALGSVNELPGTIQLMKGFVDGDGCIVDVAETRTLQPRPCTPAIRTGEHWTMPLEDDRTRDVRVLASESIQVPAGAFETMRLEVVEQPARSAAGSGGVKPLTHRALLWYAPALGFVVRAEREFVRPDGSTSTRHVEVLESFSHASAAQVPTNRLLPPDHRGSHAPQLVMSPTCQPQYPVEAIRANAMGRTEVRLAIDADGRVTDRELIGASGRTPQHRLLDEAARDSISRCRFKPATSASGGPEAATVDVQYEWRLD
jgi:TonB family protein